MERTVLRQPLDRGDFLALGADGKNQAGVNKLASQDHAAGSAVTRLAPAPGAGQVEIFPQHIEQKITRFDPNFQFLSVDLQSNRSLHYFVPFFEVRSRACRIARLTKTGTILLRYSAVP